MLRIIFRSESFPIFSRCCVSVTNVLFCHDVQVMAFMVLPKGEVLDPRGVKCTKIYRPEYNITHDLDTVEIISPDSCEQPPDIGST